MDFDRLIRRVGDALLRAAVAAALGGLLPALAPAPSAAAVYDTDSLTITMKLQDNWPPAPITDLTGLPGAEGQLLLQWTAPDGNGNMLPFLSPTATYYIRIATFSAASVGGSTTTWWNLATDVQNLAPPAIAVAPGTPGFPGTREALLISQLEPGVTYWAMILSYDQTGLFSDVDTEAVSGNQVNVDIYDALPPTPPNLSVTQTGRSTFTVTWSSVSVYDLDFYRLYIDSTSPYDFANAFKVDVDSTQTSTLLVGYTTGTYAFQIVAVDKGTPTYGGLPLESVRSSTVMADLTYIPHYPQAPFGIGLTTGPAMATLRWLPVTRFADGAAFVDPLAPTADELYGYRVFRATTPILADWQPMVSFDTATLAWTDLASGPQYYYQVRAINNDGFSRKSVVRSAASRDAFVVAQDDQSYLQVMAQDVYPVEGDGVNPMTAFLVEASSRPQEQTGRVVKSVDFAAWRAGTTWDPNMAFNGMGWLKMHYDLGEAGTVSAAGFAPRDLTPTPDNMSVYWWNGVRWVQLYGKLDALSQTMTVQTMYSGRYQLRTVERVQGFNFDQAGVSNRFVTPNGDGKNDNVVFTYDNPHDAPVTVRIIDIRGKVIMGDLPQGPVSNSKEWDGSAGGRPVPGGVYIYQIEAESQVFNGTIVIIR